MASLLNFKGSWRSYQKRILDNLNYHLRDKKLHIVAAPGAGKTTLGIEVISRLNQSTLILVPTNTIKYQWAQRIKSAFLDEKDWGIVSVDIHTPAYITVTTYQALLAALCGLKDDEDDQTTREEETDEESIVSSRRFNPQKAEEFISSLKKAKITLLCFDEAHHLRKEWWKALMFLNENLKPNQTLALTATPPYDVDNSEWERYEELCGEIDEVISIPELVKNGDLCPHQDFIYLSGLRNDEKAIVKEHNRKVNNVISKLVSDDSICNYFSKLDIFKNPKEYVEEIYDAPDFYIAIVSLLKHKHYKLSKDFLKLFDASEFEIPHFDVKQARAFFNGFIFDKSEKFPELKEVIKYYTELLRDNGLIHNKKVYLSDNIKIQRQIAHSLGKLDSIKEIVELELTQLGNNLRMVVLADFIKSDDIGNSSLGVVPIWSILKDEYCERNVLLGILCGTLIVIPKSKVDSFNSMLSEENISNDAVSISDYKDELNFVQITPKESAKNKIVSIITKMFNNGEINILVGTQALLGEGWDAPAINSLILSSTVSSYMLSNQMRGRAIRVDKNNPNKVSNIWHLASVILPKEGMFDSVFEDINQSEEETEDDSIYYDLKQLEKRFQGYEAPSYFGAHKIENGISRVLSVKTFLKQYSQDGETTIKYANSFTSSVAKNRTQTLQWWKNALYQKDKSSNMHLKSGVEAPQKTTRTLRYFSYKSFIATVFSWFVAPFFVFDVRLFTMNSFMLQLLLLWILVFICILLFFLYKYLRTGTAAGIMKQIAKVIIDSLYSEGIIKTQSTSADIVIEKNDEIFVSCSNMPIKENNIFMKCLQEFLDPIENPRYIFVRKNSILGLYKQVDYFSLPSLLSTNKSSVKTFQLLWNKNIGPCEIVYTRNYEGRRILLKARKDAFSAMKRSRSKKLSRWQ